MSRTNAEQAQYSFTFSNSTTLKKRIEKKIIYQIKPYLKNTINIQIIN